MFYILSQESLESSTDSVCKWLEFYKTKYQRINGEDLFELQNLDDIPKDNDVSLIWYRRKISSIPTKYTIKNETQDVYFKLNRFFISEFNIIHSFLCHKIDSKKWINDFVNENNLNKLTVLDLAKKCGLKIPYSNVNTTKKEIEKSLELFPELIVKPLSECIIIYFEDKNYKMLTKTINNKNIKSIPNNFSPSLIQERINKKLEIRCFYFYGEFYAMAIFSQKNKNTREDFRNYDNEKPNRNVPYTLPKIIEEKISLLMKMLKFNTGSIDLLLDINNEYYFLEINPEGQFGMVSYPCNYYIEKKIAVFVKNNT